MVGDDSDDDDDNDADDYDDYDSFQNHHVNRALVVETCCEGINQILCQNCNYCQKRSGNLNKHI